jgi:hypothetical protein
MHAQSLTIEKKLQAFMQVEDDPRQAYDKIFQALEAHQEWFANSIPLIASENVPSPAVREAIISDFGNRYAEGWAGESSEKNTRRTWSATRRHWGGFERRGS